jgi:16S rRNA (guanine527-N7)-methyltransferase
MTNFYTHQKGDIVEDSLASTKITSEPLTESLTEPLTSLSFAPLFASLFEQWQSTLNWLPNQRQNEQFAQLYTLVLEGNRQQNLTRITEINDFWEKHLWDSLRGIWAMQEREGLQAIDIGTGAGFPGLAIAIAKPSWQVTMIDSTQKKVNFVQQVIKELGLTNAIAISGRAETLATLKIYRRKFDLAVIRAVGKPDICAEYCLPFLNKKGNAVLYRGQWLSDESDQLNVFCEEQNIELVKVDRFQTPLSAGLRHSVYLSPRSTSISNS